MSPPRCDIVVTTRDRPDALGRMLDALATQTVRDFSVIVVDDASREPVEPLVLSDRHAPLARRVVRLDRPSGPAAGRNAGVAAATAELVIFLDDDVVACPRFVELHLDAVRTGTAEEPVVSFGPFVEPEDWRSPTAWNRWEAHQARKETRAMLDGVYAPTWRQFHTGNNCLPRAVFEEVGGFDERFRRSEDDELALRLHLRGCRFVHVPDAIGWHYSNRSKEAWLLTPRAYAYFDTLLDALHPEVGHLTNKTNELRDRHPAMRAVRAALVGRRAKLAGVRAAVGLAELADRVGARRPANALLSLAYDLSYVQSLEDTAAGRSELGPRPEVG